LGDCPHTGCVGASWARQDGGLAGREVGQQRLAEALDRAAKGQPCAMVVHGEAGVGKTRLVSEVCDGLGAEARVLWGGCMHFGQASVPFAPVTGALRSWLAHADASDRAEVLAGADDLATLLPALGDARVSDSGALLPLIDLVFDRLAARAPTVVVIDDLQWADRTSLDVLAYLIAGFREQRLALLATCRDEHRGEGHPLHTWLADMRRMPRVAEIHLERLELDATQAQIEGLFGGVVDLGFTAEVQERSGGNPYLTELLVRGLDRSAQMLPETAPTALKAALVASWHGLSADARRATRLLAVSGRPTDSAVLVDVATHHGLAPAQLSECLTEALDHGIVQSGSEGRWWFRHPLLADVLYDGMPPGEAARVHATFVRVLQGISSGARERAAVLAVHNERASRVDEGYRWSLVAADHAADLHATAEEALHLERACSLWIQLPPAARSSPTEQIQLLRRASQACGRVGRHDSAVALIDQALTLTGRDSEPLQRSALLVEAWKANYRRAAPAKTVSDELVEAVRLTDAYPSSVERALAFAALASAEEWDSMHAEAIRHADEAVQVAQNSGSDLATAAALTTRALVHSEYLEADTLPDAEEAMRRARLCGSTECLEEAAIWYVSCLPDLDARAAVAQQVFEEVVAGGSEWAYLLADHAARMMLWKGRWAECWALLRTALAARCAAIPGAAIRLTAAQLATRRGLVAEAKLHLDRALDLIPKDFARLRGRLSFAAAELFMARGQPDQAMRFMHARIQVPKAGSATEDEDDLVAFAQAAAETAEAARAEGDREREAHAIADLDDLIDRWPHQPFTQHRRAGATDQMLKALFDAEVARCKAMPGQAELWQRAMDTSHAAGWPWDETLSALRCAEAMLATGSPASAVSDLIRRAHVTAVQLGALPLQEKAESLAQITRVTLQQPAPITPTPTVPAPLAGLTARERQILAFLVAGRSNGQIARQLVISDKTVSVHVSNILRKTGTSSRVEVAALAQRLAAIPDSR
jgi:DNA-binding CsgD family transcriptional regulator/tetratricopeptide (TPR) repeat protein